MFLLIVQKQINTFLVNEIFDDWTDIFEDIVLFKAQYL